MTPHPMVAPAHGTNPRCTRGISGCTCRDVWVCPTCRNTRKVEREVPHDGSDYPDKRGHLERRMVPCPDCKTSNS